MTSLHLRELGRRKAAYEMISASAASWCFCWIRNYANSLTMRELTGAVVCELCRDFHLFMARRVAWMVLHWLGSSFPNGEIKHTSRFSFQGVDQPRLKTERIL